MTPDINTLTDWVAVAAVIPFALYTLIYGIGSPWYRSILGWVLFGLGLATTAALTYVAVRRIVGDFPGWEFWSLAVYSVLALVGWALVGAVVVERRRASLALIPLKKKKKKETESV